MSYPEIYRQNVDSNNSLFQRDAVIQVITPDAPIKLPQNYTIVVEKAEIPITTMPMNILEWPHYIMIDYPPSAPAHPVLQPKLNIFWISGEYASVDDFLRKVNKIICDDLLPGISCGSFSYNRNDDRIEFKFGDATDLATLALGVEVYFDSKLIWMLSDIPGLYSATPDTTLTMPNDPYLRMHQLTYSNYLNGATTPVIKQQNLYLIPRLYGFKSIRIFSTLPTRGFGIYNQNSNILTNTQMLGEIMINSENYREGLANILYIPQNFVHSELTGVTPITEFTLRFSIHYKNGIDLQLNQGPGEYMSVTLGFYAKSLEK